MKYKNLVNLCDSCLRREDFPNCYETESILFGNSIGYDNIIYCNMYEPKLTTIIINQPDDKKEIILEEAKEFWPNRFLTTKERCLLIAKILRYTSESISNTIPINEKTESKTMDSKLIERFLSTEHNEDDIKLFFLLLGLQIRKFLTNPKNRRYIGLCEIKTDFIVDLDEIEKDKLN